MKTVTLAKVCNDFVTQLNEIQEYLDFCKNAFHDQDKYLSNSYELASIQTYKAFEFFAMRCLISCLNHDHSKVETKYGVKFGKHINDDVCMFIITKGGYFDFKDRSGLIQIINCLIGNDHKVSQSFKNNEYKNAIEQLCAIRNYAAHNSQQSKTKAKERFGLKQIGTAGSCLKCNCRYKEITDQLRALASRIKSLS